MFIIRLHMLPFRPYIVRGLPFTEEYQTTRCTVWMKRTRTAAFFTTVSDMLLWHSRSERINQRVKLFIVVTQKPIYKTAVITGFRHMVFLFKKIYMIIIWLKGKQWFDRTQKYWHFLLLRNQDFKYCSMVCCKSTHL